MGEVHFDGHCLALVEDGGGIQEFSLPIFQCIVRPSQESFISHSVITHCRQRQIRLRDEHLLSSGCLTVLFPFLSFWWRGRFIHSYEN